VHGHHSWGCLFLFPSPNVNPQPGTALKQPQSHDLPSFFFHFCRCALGEVPCIFPEHVAAFGFADGLSAALCYPARDGPAMWCSPATYNLYVVGRNSDFGHLPNPAASWLITMDRSGCKRRSPSQPSFDRYRHEYLWRSGLGRRQPPPPRSLRRTVCNLSHTFGLCFRKHWSTTLGACAYTYTAVEFRSLRPLIRARSISGRGRWGSPRQPLSSSHSRKGRDRSS